MHGKASTYLEEIKKLDHPFLNRKFEMGTDTKEFIFKSTLSLETHSFVGDHSVFNTAVVPFSAYFEMIVVALQEVGKCEQVSIEDCEIREPVILVASFPKELQIKLVRHNHRDSHYSVEISSRPSNGLNQPWTLNVSCAGKTLISTAQRKQELKNLVDRCRIQVSHTQQYEISKELGIDYGPCFQGLTNTLIGQMEAIGKVEVVPQIQSTAANFQIHPAFLDACFQVLYSNFFVCGIPAPGKSAYLPWNIESINFYSGTSAKPCWSYVKLDAPFERENKSIQGSIQIFDEEGNVLIEFKGFVCVEATQEAIQLTLAKLKSASRPRVEKMFYTPKWQHSKSLAQGPRPIEKSDFCVILANKEPIADILASIYETLGGKAVVVNLTGGSGFESTLRSIKDGGSRLREIIHVRSLSLKTFNGVRSASWVEDSQRLGSWDVVSTLNTLSKFGLGTDVRFSILTQGATTVGDAQNEFNYSQSPIWGLAQAIRIEHPEMNCRCFDLDPSTRLDNRNLNIVMSEILSSDDEPQVAFRDDKKWILRLLPVEEPRDSDKKTKIDSNASYLITGGLGALGINTAVWLAENGAKHICLVGRKAAGKNTASVIEKIESLGAKVKVFQLNVAVEAEVIRLSDALRDGPPLKGIFHAAGTFESRFLFSENWQTWQQALEAKVKGTWNLNNCFGHLPLDFVVLFSSGAAILPAPGQAAYAAANSFLDCYSQASGAFGGRIVSVNWGPWENLGMASAQANGVENQESMERGGMRPLSATDGFRVLGLLLGNQARQVCVMPVDWSVYLRSLPEGTNTLFLSNVANEVTKPEIGKTSELNGVPAVSKIAPLPPVIVPAKINDVVPVVSAVEKTVVPAKAEPTKNTDQTEFVKNYFATPKENRIKYLEKGICKEVSLTLNLAEDINIDPSIGLLTLGLDSLGAIELRGRIKKNLGSLGKGIPATVVFNHPSVAALAKYLTTAVLTDDANAQVSGSSSDRAAS